MSLFAAELQRLELLLEIPYPERREVLAEIGDHLEALHGEFREQGLGEVEAQARALQTLGADASFVADMAEVHRPAIARALELLPRSVALGIEYITIGLIGAALVGAVMKEASMIEFISSGGFFMIPINLAGGAILALGLERIYSLFIKRDHSRANLGRRLLSLRFLAVACVMTGIVGTLVGFYQAFSAAESIAARFGGSFPIYEVARVAMTTSIWGLLLALIAVCFRFVAEAKVARIRGQELA